jgi:hypothetical protein
LELRSGAEAHLRLFTLHGASLRAMWGESLKKSTRAPRAPREAAIVA